MWFRVLSLTVVSAFVASGFARAAEAAPAQDTSVEAKAGETSGENSSGEAKPTEDATTTVPDDDVAKPAPLKGDILHMKNGKVISGFQVLRETASVYVLEVVPGEDITLEVPRRQVTSIDYDDIDPNAPKPAVEESDGEPELVSISGQKVTPELQEKLSADISTPSLSYKDADLVQILNDVGERVGGALSVDQTVVDTPAPFRTWTLDIKPGTTLIQFLREDLKTKFELLEWVLLTDKVVVATKEGAEKLRSENKPAADASVPPPAPAAPGAAPAPNAPGAPAAPGPIPAPAPAPAAPAVPPAAPATGA